LIINAKNAKKKISLIARSVFEPIPTIFLMLGKWFFISSPAFVQASYRQPNAKPVVIAITDTAFISI
jgi:hypothetical protein